MHADFIRLITNENDFAKRTSGYEDCAKFTKAFEQVADDILGKYKAPCKVLVQFTCTPSGHTVKIMHQPKDIDEKPLKELYKAVAKLDKLPVKEESVEFQIQLTITPKKESPSNGK